MNVLVNFTIGLLLALIFFIFGLWGIVQSYQPNPFIAVLVFCGATCSAFAYVMTYLVAIYGAAAGGVYGVLKVAETSATRRQRQQPASLHDQQQRQQQQRVQQQNQYYHHHHNEYRPHYQ